jgi:hypothetical protein
MPAVCRAYVHVDSDEVAEPVQRPTVICAMSVSFGPRSEEHLLSFVGWVDGSWVERAAGVGQEPDHQAVAVADALDALFGSVGDLGQGGGGQVGQLEVLEVGPQASTGLGSGRRRGAAQRSASRAGCPARPAPGCSRGHRARPTAGRPCGRRRSRPAAPAPRSGRRCRSWAAAGGNRAGRRWRRVGSPARPPSTPSSSRTGGAGSGCGRGRPGAPHRRDQQDGRFVEEDEPGRFCAGPLLVLGHSWATQRAIACSSRSAARRSGRCSVQPRRWRRITQTWPGW